MTLAYTMHFDYTAWADETDTANRREAEWRLTLAREQIEAATFPAAATFWRDIERRATARLEQLNAVTLVGEEEVRA